MLRLNEVVQVGDIWELAWRRSASDWILLPLLSFARSSGLHSTGLWATFGRIPLEERGCAP